MKGTKVYTALDTYWKHASRCQKYMIYAIPILLKLFRTPLIDSMQI